MPRTSAAGLQEQLAALNAQVSDYKNQLDVSNAKLDNLEHVVSAFKADAVQSHLQTTKYIEVCLCLF